ncbi:hypothetical protein DXX93_11595 [Thalassotalea euphylliae]|uniref:Uncharacterized protein n=1 Tax=Thalassotalea euphylliae TaxID=1655234 RepID=A0A3E0TRB0_9GAMM|nr:hypothetical protein [Thalassotalea euphylliae]REL27146.1 hypothetical protein DXX93_11595 [Thalassotalea euphylliae]
MESLRELIATLCFIAGTILVTSMLAQEFSWLMLIAPIILYATAYLCWPSKRRGKRDSENVVLDIIELIIEFPVEFFLWLFRLLGRVLASLLGAKGDGLDIDI